LEIRTDEGFSDVPVPEFVGFGGCHWVGLEIKLFLRADEKQIKVLACLPGSNLSRIVRIPLAVRV
jgi:hypothetical protein